MARFEIFPKDRNSLDFNLSVKSGAVEFITNNFEAIKKSYRRVRPLDSATRHDITQARMDGNKTIRALEDAGVLIG